MKITPILFSITPLFLASCVATTPEPRTKTTVINGANGSKVIMTTGCNSKKYSIGLDNNGGASGSIEKGDCVDMNKPASVDADIDFDLNVDVDAEIDENGNLIRKDGKPEKDQATLGNF